jgi:hypothetical protein
MSGPIIKMVSVHDELKRARDAFYSAMFRWRRNRNVCKQMHAVGYYESMDGITCP